MSKLYITEYTNLPQIGTMKGPIASSFGTDQAPIDFSTVVSSAAFAANTKYVRLVADAACTIAFGSAPVATANNALLPANTIEYYAVAGGQKVSALHNP